MYKAILLLFLCIKSLSTSAIINYSPENDLFYTRRNYTRLVLVADVSLNLTDNFKLGWSVIFGDKSLEQPIYRNIDYECGQSTKCFRSEVPIDINHFNGGNYRFLIEVSEAGGQITTFMNSWEVRVQLREIFNRVAPAIDRGEVTIVCPVSGYPVNRVAWFKMNSEIINDQHHQISNKNRVNNTLLKIQEVSRRDINSYSCEAEGNGRLFSIRVRIGVRERNAWIYPIIGMICIILFLGCLIGIYEYKDKIVKTQEIVFDKNLSKGIKR